MTLPILSEEERSPQHWWPQPHGERERLVQCQESDGPTAGEARVSLGTSEHPGAPMASSNALSDQEGSLKAQSQRDTGHCPLTPHMQTLLSWNPRPILGRGSALKIVLPSEAQGMEGDTWDTRVSIQLSDRLGMTGPYASLSVLGNSNCHPWAKSQRGFIFYVPFPQGL